MSGLSQVLQMLLGVAGGAVSGIAGERERDKERTSRAQLQQNEIGAASGLEDRREQAAARAAQERQRFETEKGAQDDLQHGLEDQWKRGIHPDQGAYMDAQHQVAAGRGLSTMAPGMNTMGPGMSQLLAGAGQTTSAAGQGYNQRLQAASSPALNKLIEGSDVSVPLEDGLGTADITPTLASLRRVNVLAKSHEAVAKTLGGSRVTAAGIHARTVGGTEQDKLYKRYQKHADQSAAQSRAITLSGNYGTKYATGADTTQFNQKQALQRESAAYADSATDVNRTPNPDALSDEEEAQYAGVLAKGFQPTDQSAQAAVANSPHLTARVKERFRRMGDLQGNMQQEELEQRFAPNPE